MNLEKKVSIFVGVESILKDAHKIKPLRRRNSSAKLRKISLSKYKSSEKDAFSLYNTLGVDIDEVILASGSFRISAVRKLIEVFFVKAPYKGMILMKW